MTATEKQFVHLHVHTQYSLLDGAARIPDIFAFARKHNMPAIAITDHGNMYGAMDYFHAARDEWASLVKKIKLEKAIKEYEEKLKEDPSFDGNKPEKDDIVFNKEDEKEYADLYIKPIIGCEFYTVPDMHKMERGKNDHLIILAKDDVGYHNLMKLNTFAWKEGYFGGKPRIDLEMLEKYKEGLICLSACIAGRIPRYILDDDYDSALAYAKRLKDMFGDDFYIEIQNHKFIENGRNLEQISNIGLIKIAKELNLKLVATNDAHYVKREDAKSHDVLLCIQTASYVDEEKRLRFPNDEFYLKTYDEMAELFPSIPEALTNTLEIANKITLEMPKKKALLPPFVPDNGQTPADYLSDMARANLSKRYKVVTPEIMERCNSELNVIISMGYVEYFLIVWDFIRYAKENGIPVGAGRGSGVGSIVAYSIGITNVDPLRFHLIFERFLNVERVSMPDFDIDFCSIGRSKVIEYVTQKYGKNNVTQIITFGTLAAKQCIKDVSRAFRIPYAEVDKMTKPIASMPGLCLKGILGEYDENDPKQREKYGKMKCPEFIELYHNDSQVRMVVDIARDLEGMPRNTGMHAAGVVICKDDVSDHIPLQHNDGVITTQYPKDQVEELGLLKMDFLGLTNLTDLKYTKEYILENHGVTVDFDKLGYEDPAVYKLISSGETDAVFQLESGGMKSFMMQLAPSGMEDIIAGISLYRPGPMDSIPKYIENKKHPEKVVYLDERLRPILDNTYGVIVYQEQVMQIVRELGGYSFGRADILRRIMSKKKQKEMIIQRHIFLYGQESDGKNSKVIGALKNGVKEEVANALFDEMTSFAKYAFNKSHAAAYAVLSYETAYMKLYYMPEFITGVLNNRSKVTDDVEKYVGYLREHGVPVTKPDVNSSKTLFSTDGKTVNYGISVIKGSGYEASQKLVEERNANGPYTSFQNLLERQEVMINKTMLEALIMSGACDCFGHTRATLMRYYESIISAITSDKKKRETGQISMFDSLFDNELGESSEIKMTEVAEFDKSYLLEKEKELLCVYMSGNPLDDYIPYYGKIPFKLGVLRELTRNADDDSQEFDIGEAKDSPDKYDGQLVKVGGMLSEVSRKTSKKGSELCVGRIEDIEYNCEFACFGNPFQTYKPYFVKNAIVLMDGRLSYKDGRYSIVVSSVKPWIVDKESASVSSEPQIGLDYTVRDEQLENESLIDYSKKVLLLKLDGVSDRKQRIFDVLKKHAGNEVVYSLWDGKFYTMPTKAKYSDALVRDLQAVIGDNNVELKDKKV